MAAQFTLHSYRSRSSCYSRTETKFAKVANHSVANPTVIADISRRTNMAALRMAHRTWCTAVTTIELLQILRSQRPTNSQINAELATFQRERQRINRQIIEEQTFNWQENANLSWKKEMILLPLKVKQTCRVMPCSLLCDKSQQKKTASTIG
jgi:hypothetical protein